MGTPLGPTLANFYASYVENKVFDINPSLKLKVYSRWYPEVFPTDTFSDGQIFRKVYIYTFNIDTGNELYLS